VPVAVTQAYTEHGHLKLADKLYLLEQTAFPDGQPMNPYEDMAPILPWLLPAGLPISAALLMGSVIGVYREQRRDFA